MRRFWLSALAITMFVAFPADAATLAAHDVGRATGVGQAGAASAVLIDARGRVSLRTDDGTRRPIPTPAGCAFAAAGSGHLLWTCGAGPDANAQRLAVTSLSGRSPVRLTPAATTGADAAAVMFTRIGTQWLAAPIAGYHYSTTVYLNWHTGREVTGRDDADRSLAVDLDSPGLHRALCRPLRRQHRPVRDTIDEDDPLLALSYQPPWSATLTPAGVLLGRCGTARTITIPGVRAEASMALFGGWLAWQRRSDGPGLVHLLRLRDRRSFSVRTQLIAVSGLTLTRGTLYIAGSPTATRRIGRFAVHSVSLPRG